MTFYVVHGAANACGDGCDRWIEAEGAVDTHAAARFKAFISRRYDRTLPIYFHSPGGNLDQAVAIGNLLHERPVMARVGRTVVKECGFEAQDGETCRKVKQSGRELHGDLSTRHAICASACPYLILGAASRQVAPDAMLAVHSSKVFLSFRNGVKPSPAMIAAATEQGRERSARLLSGYFARLRADAALLDLVKTVKFEDMHVLTRDEIFRFGIDRREFVETPWSVDGGPRINAAKVVAQRVGGENAFRTIRWRLSCFDNERFELDVQRSAGAQSAPASVAIEDGDTKLQSLQFLSAKTPAFEVWGTRMARASVRSLADLPQFELAESSLASDGQHRPRKTKLSNEGLLTALDRLIVGCPAPKNVASADAAASRAGD